MKSSLDSPFVQKTIARPVAIDGVGIHTGIRAQVRLVPAPEGSGVRFRRTDRGVDIPAVTSYISSLELATTLGRGEVTVSTVEHLLAAVHLLGIDNLTIEIDAPEVPILDGSALPYLRLLETAGVCLQGSRRRVVAVTRPIRVESEGKSIRISPYPGLRIRYSIDFGKTAIGRQEISLVVDRTSFERELAPARTFALHADVEPMRRNGLGLGGDPDNCVIFDERGPMNTPLRFANEPVRHKALDAVGDLALLGAPLWGDIEVVRGGHQLHCQLLEALKNSPDSWDWISGAVTPMRSVRVPVAGPTMVSSPLPLDL